MIAEISTHAILDLFGGKHLNLVVEENRAKNNDAMRKIRQNREKYTKSFNQLLKMKDLEDNCFGPTYLVGTGKESKATNFKLY